MFLGQFFLGNLRTCEFNFIIFITEDLQVSKFDRLAYSEGGRGGSALCPHQRLQEFPVKQMSTIYFPGVLDSPVEFWSKQ